MRWKKLLKTLTSLVMKNFQERELLRLTGGTLLVGLVLNTGWILIVVGFGSKGFLKVAITTTGMCLLVITGMLIERLGKRG